MLNGNELMLGDYVNISDYDFDIVLGVIKEIHNDGTEMLVSIAHDKVFDTLSDGDIHPIRLSKEFFLKNDFVVVSDEGGYVMRLHNPDLNFEVIAFKEDNFVCDINQMKVAYVHEFQHLLRLMGLFGYANKLKI